MPSEIIHFVSPKQSNQQPVQDFTNRDAEIFTYAEMKGETEKFDLMKQLEEEKRKHKKNYFKSKSQGCSQSKAVTKNLLRNLNQAMLRYLCRSKSVQEQLMRNFDANENECKKFKAWATRQKMYNFQECRQLWSFKDNDVHAKYLSLLREIQFDFYENASCPAIFSSRVRDCEGKLTHLQYIHTFLMGMIDPQSFTCFKKSTKKKEKDGNIEKSRGEDNKHDEIHSQSESESEELQDSLSVQERNEENMQDNNDNNIEEQPSNQEENTKKEDEQSTCC